MKWTEFLDSAARLAQGGTEGDWQSAVSRAYYAVFHSFRDFFKTHGLDLGRSGQSHFNLDSGLLHCGFAAATGIAARVDTLRNDRTLADYDLHSILVQKAAGDTVQRSRALLADFQTLLTTVPAAQIVAGAKKHLQAIGRVP
ncbi:MAG: HEPN domain-containing protein [Gemmataceae bacterium]|nr:HEPN domain-containing protein [Gemmataceae bacterium]MCI0738169.1 HEPN domain-containing protein [Gemmataceae bacterium]